MSLSFFWAYVLLQIPAGLLLDQLGPRRLLISAALVCSLGTGLFASAESLFIASIGRFWTGVGSAFAFLSCVKVATIWFPPHKLSILIGLTLFLGTLGASAGGLPMSLLVDIVGWRNALGLMALLGVGISLLFWIVFKVSGSKNLQSNSKLYNKEEPQKLGILEWFRIILKKPESWILAFYGMMMHIPMVGFADMWSVSFLTCVHQLDRSSAAFSASIFYLGIGIGTPFWAYITNIIQKFNPVLQFASLGNLVLLLTILYVPGLPAIIIYILMFLIGITVGGGFIVYSVVCALNPLSISGNATGFQNSMSLMSGVIFQPFLGALLNYFSLDKMENGVSTYSSSSYQYTMTSIAVCVALSFLSILFIREYHPKNKNQAKIEGNEHVKAV